MSADDNSKKNLLHAVEAAIRRSPFLDREAQEDAVQHLREITNGPPIDLPKDYMSPERAEFVRRLRIDEGYSFRALAAECSQAWGTNWGSNQYCGTELCFLAAEILHLSPESFQ
jgi:hypothetical protein